MIDSIYGRDYPVRPGADPHAGAPGLAGLPRDRSGAGGARSAGRAAMTLTAALALTAPASRRPRWIAGRSASAGPARDRPDLRVRSRRLRALRSARLRLHRACCSRRAAAHPFGTDNFGRDMLSRVIWATRVDMQIAIFSTLFPLIFGTLVGVAGRLLRRLARRALRPARRSDRHLPVPGARDRHRRGARARPLQHVYRGQRRRLGVLRPADAGRDPGAEAERLCRRRPRAGLWRARASSSAICCPTRSRRSSSIG